MRFKGSGGWAWKQGGTSRSHCKPKVSGMEMEASLLFHSIYYFNKTMEQAKYEF